MFGILQFAQRLGLTVAAIDTHTLKSGEDNALDLPSTNTDDQYTPDRYQTNPDTPNADIRSHPQDGQQHPLTNCDFPNISDSSRTSPVISEEDFSRQEETVVSDSSERAGSSDRADSDIVFRTAPNTPVLVKHLTIVSDEVDIDSPGQSSDIVTYCEAKYPLGAGLDFPSADSESVNEEVIDIEYSTTQSSDQTVSETEESVVEELGEKELKRGMCEEMNHGPGDLYDIAEEETSEEEEDPSEEEDEEEEEDDDDDDSGNVTQPTNEDEYPDEIIKKNNVNRETRELEARLSASEAESNKLLCKIDDLQRDVMVKSGGMEQELKETEDGFDFNHLLRVEEQAKELTVRVKELESQLEQLRQERNQLEQRARTLEAERQEERRIIQEALDNAIAEKHSIQTKFEKDFERLRTVNTDREQHLLDDFEWKLREVNQACKKKLEEKENACKERIKTMEDKLKLAEQELTKMENLKQFEVEATQLRGLNLEQQRALRFAERTKEQLQVSEKVLQEEVKKLEESLEKEKTALTTMQAIHNREIDEKERKMRFRLEQQKTELKNEWEEKLRKETIRLRVELDQINRDEKRVVLQSARLEKEAELERAKEKWEHQFEELQTEIESLKQKLTDSEEEHKSKIENIRTTADCDVFDLRRKLDRIDISYQDKIEKLQMEHDKEKERLAEEAERRLQSAEQGWQMQLSSTRATLELVKEQLKREAVEREEELHTNHRRQLELQWEQLMQERDEIIAVLEEKHKAIVEKLRAELEAAYKCRNNKEQELADIVAKIQEDDCGKESLIGDLTSQAQTLNENIDQLNKKLASQEQNFQQAQEESDKKIKLLEDAHRRTCQELTMTHQQEVDQWRTTVNLMQLKINELTNQLEQSKESKLVEDLRKALSEKEHQVAQLSKEKHLYQLELMNRNCHGDSTTVTARQRRRGNRGKPNKPGPSRGQPK